MDAAAAGDWLTSTEIEVPRPFAYAADLVVPPGLEAQFAAVPTTQPLSLVRMRDVTFLPIPSMAFRGDALVAATARPGIEFNEPWVRERLASMHDRLGPDRRVFMASVRYSGNYYHQLVEIIPAALAYADDPGFAEGLLLSAAVALVPLLPAALRLAGVVPPQIVPVPTTSPPLDIGDLTYCTLLNGVARPSLFARSVYDRLIAGAGASDGPRLIYVWRADAIARPMRNEDELVERLTGLGVEPVVLSGMSLAEQVRLFRGARLVIGPHGAGMANVVFGTPGAVMYELLPSHYINPCMARLAQLRGLHYWCDVHPAEARADLWRHDTPWTVDIGAVLARVAEILSAYRLA